MLWSQWLSPLRYLYGAMMTASLGDLTLNCIEEDLVTFYPPPGQTCYDYAANYLATTSGYLVDGSSTTSCQYCTSSTGYDYIQQIGFSNGTKWRDWAITIIWCLSNIFFCYLFTWWVSINTGQVLVTNRFWIGWSRSGHCTRRVKPFASDYKYINEHFFFLLVLFTPTSIILEY